MPNELDHLLDKAAQKKDNKEKPLEFPVDFYPEREQELINDLCDSKGLSKQHLGLGMLPVFGRIYNKYRGHAFNGVYQILPIFWVAIIDRPGTSKSESLKAWYRQLSKYNDYGDPENIVSYTANDTTPEGLVHNMADRDDGIYLFYDEITKFTGGMGQYKKNGDADKAFWLSLFSGDSEAQWRVGSIRNMKEQPISVGGTSQPDTLRNAFAGDLNNGFFERFLWSVERNKLPEINDNPNFKIDDDVKHRIQKHIEFPKFNAIIKFSPKARDLLKDWYSTTRNIAEKSHDDTLGQFLGKDVTYINRFAMLTNVMYREGDTSPISLASAERAIKLYEFCNAMRKRAHEIVISEEDSVTESILTLPSVARWITTQLPNINKKELADLLKISRRVLYER